MRKTICACAVLLLAVGVAMSQDTRRQRPGQGGFGGFGGFGPGMGRGASTMLLMNKGVQEELKLTDEQKDKIKAYSEEAMKAGFGQFGKLRDLPENERREKMQAMMKEMAEKAEKFVDETLKPEQKTRLKQISYQQMGVQAFSDKEVAEKLKLTDEQKEKIEGISKQSREEMGQLFRSGGSREEMGPKLTALRKETMEKVQGVLTADQKKIWSELTGAPFELRMEGFGGFGGGFGGNRPGGGRPGRPIPKKDD